LIFTKLVVILSHQLNEVIMTKKEAIRFFHTETAIAKIIGVSQQSVSKSVAFRPIAQLKLFIASGGQLALDESLATLIAEVVKVMFWEDGK
jgi:hypothetical protein